MVLLKIIATVFVAVGPLLAQRGYRWYAEKGIDELRLQDPSEVAGLRDGSQSTLGIGIMASNGANGTLDDHVEIRNSLEHGEIGFRPLCRAIKNRRNIEGEITEIILLSGQIIEVEKHLNLGIPIETCVDDNVVVYVRYKAVEDGERVSKKEPILYQPVDSRETAKKLEMRVRDTTRGEYAPRTEAGF